MTIKAFADVEKIGGKWFLKLDAEYKAVVERIAETAASKGKRVRVEICLERARRANSQNALYWATLPTLHFLVNGNWPTREELESFHDDFKTVHGLRRPSRLNPKILVPVPMREADVSDASALIDALFSELAERGGDASPEMQTKSRMAWFDYWESGGATYVDESDFHARATLCAACGSGSDIDLAHMESRGANLERKDDPKNWVPLCRLCHSEQHRIGVTQFLTRHPHLRKRWLGTEENGAVRKKVKNEQ